MCSTSPKYLVATIATMHEIIIAWFARKGNGIWFVVTRMSFQNRYMLVFVFRKYHSYCLTGTRIYVWNPYHWLKATSNLSSVSSVFSDQRRNLFFTPLCNRPGEAWLFTRFLTKILPGQTKSHQVDPIVHQGGRRFINSSHICICLQNCAPVVKEGTPIALHFKNMSTKVSYTRVVPHQSKQYSQN